MANEIWFMGREWIWIHIQMDRSFADWIEVTMSNGIFGHDAFGMIVDQHLAK